MDEISDKLNKKYKLTKEHYKIFKKEILKWIDKLSLKDWKIHFLWGKDTSDTAAYAYVLTDYSGKKAYFALNKLWQGRKPSPKEIKLAARHEALELLLAETRFFMSKFETEQEVIDAVIHSIIYRLEYLFQQLS